MLRRITSRRNFPSVSVGEISFVPGLIDGDRVVAEVRKQERLPQLAAVGVGIGAHAPFAGGRKLPEFGNQRALLIEELLRPIAAHPLLDDPQMLGIGLHVQHRNLVGSPEAFDSVAIDLLSARSIPLGVRRIIIGQRGRSGLPVRRASCWMDRICWMQSRRVAAIF